MIGTLHFGFYIVVKTRRWSMYGMALLYPGIKLVVNPVSTIKSKVGAPSLRIFQREIPVSFGVDTILALVSIG